MWFWQAYKGNNLISTKLENLGDPEKRMLVIGYKLKHYWRLYWTRGQSQQCDGYCKSFQANNAK